MNYVADSPIFYTWYPLFAFLLGTGCRIGEVIGLRWDDVNLENRTIDINHSLTYYPRQEKLMYVSFEYHCPKPRQEKSHSDDGTYI